MRSERSRIVAGSAFMPPRACPTCQYAIVARFRHAIVGACVMLATLTAVACGQITDRMLACGEVPADVCVRLASDISPGFERRSAESGPIVRVTITPSDCPGDLAATRCWHVEATNQYGAGSSAIYYQRADGALVDARDNSLVGG